MKFSIITINYNNRQGLQRTMRSISAQVKREFEWIVIDGGSSDGSRELLELNSHVITYWCSEPDKGIYNAMNKGVLYAKGDYCLFLNSGDELCDSNVMKTVGEIPFQSDIVSFDMYVDVKSLYGYRTSPDDVNAYWLYDNSLYHPASWIRRDLLIKLPYEEKYCMVSDWIFFYEALVMCYSSYQHVAIPISVFYRDGISCNPTHVQHAIKEKKQYLQTRFPEKYIDDKEKDSSFHYISSGISRMSPFSQKVMRYVFLFLIKLDKEVLNRHN